MLKAPEIALLALLEVIFGIAAGLGRRRRSAEPDGAGGRRAGDRRAGGQRTGGLEIERDMSEHPGGVRTGMGLITLNRPKALNALSPSMIRELTSTLLEPGATTAAVQRSGDPRPQGREAPFGAFCAGGDIRLFPPGGAGGRSPAGRTSSPRSTARFRRLQCP